MLTRLRWSAVFMAVFWPIGMILWSPELRSPAGMVVFSIGGAFVGLLWYAMMKRYMEWQLARNAGQQS